ncbi:DUF1129 family protein [Lentibacillus saliphilus]|uniref:DUF1129 family protein n=1 Tax=Lentibacillus saliphilus TaxID=2737028 RepID=UPI001C2F5188|nr:DUF1129 family protein [Lentibacillus saliphilus]
MLSNQSEQFIVELRMYLMSKGKRDKDIDEIVDQLTDHLHQAEKEGKSVAHITGDSPKTYMQRLGQEMDFDKKQTILLVPQTILLMMAFFSFTPAVAGTFSLSILGLISYVVMGIIGIVIYGVIVVKVLPKLFHSKWFYGILIGAFIIVTGTFVVIMFIEEGMNSEPFFVASPLQNNLIAVACIAIFIATALYIKAWFPVLIALFLSIAPLGQRFVPEHINKDPFWITVTIVISVLISIGVAVFLMIKWKKKKTA